MSESRKPVDWKRLLIEGLVIVVSILLAFSIDAWWRQQQEARDADDQVARVVAELNANIAILNGHDEALDYTTRAAREFLAMMGPDVEPVSNAEVGSMMGRIFSVSTLSLGKSATQNFLSSGQLTDGHWIDIRLALSEMLSDAQVAETTSSELRRMRPDILEHEQNFVSGLDIVRDHALMADYPASQFMSEPDALLSDMKFEGLIANYAIRMEINREIIRELLNRHNAVIGMIENKQ
jgi:hypothetical protein